MAKIIKPDFGKAVGSFLDTPGAYNICRGLSVTYTDRLKDYLEAQANKDILISAYKPHGHMAVAEVNIQQISEERADTLISKGAPYVIGEMGRIIISKTWIPDARKATIELDLQSWMGVKAICAKGLKRPDVLTPYAPLLQPQD